ncbi:MAG: superoxide dismutase [Deltaproteobacteria bacterium]|nr:superoxide dismutase [Deltaproteobacteria bacterium]
MSRHFAAGPSKKIQSIITGPFRPPYLISLPALIFGLVLSLCMTGCGGSGTGSSGGISSTPPKVISLPDGFRPEGIAISGTQLFTGSITTGRIFRADITDGQGEVVVSAREGRSAIGMKIDSRGRLFVAGGQTGQAYVYNAGTGADLAVYALAQGNTFINDVIITADAAWFTDSRNPVIYKVPIKPDGSLADQAAITPLPLTGDFQLAAGQTNANGIAAASDGTLIIVQSVTGKLFTVDPTTGATHVIDLGAETVINGDGILLEGRTLFVMQNRLNRLAVVRLSQDLSSGTVEKRITDPLFDVPTTIAAVGKSLYLVNARFGTADPDSAEYSAIRIDKP